MCIRDRTCGDRSIEGDFQNVDDYSLYEGMKQVAKTGKVLAIHAENAPITDKLGAVAYQNGETTLAAYVATRPVFTEVEAIQKAILFAKETGCRKLALTRATNSRFENGFVT